jgi:DNA gyrase subunit A
MTSGNGKYLAIFSENGYGKRCEISEFRTMNRGAMGVVGYKVTDKTGKVSFAEVCEEGEIFLISKDGYCVRMNIAEIPIQRRSASGVLINKRGIKKGFLNL